MALEEPPINRLIVLTVVLFVASTYITLYHSLIGENRPGTPLLFPDHEWNLATAEIASRFGGVDSFVVFMQGDKDKASGDAEPILRMESIKASLRALGRSLRKNEDGKVK